MGIELAPIAAKAVSGLIAGLFGGKKKEETVARVDYQYVRDAASAAGFNPLTALMYTGSANTNTTSNDGGFASRAFIAEAATDAVAAGFDHKYRKDLIDYENKVAAQARADILKAERKKAEAFKGFGQVQGAPESETYWEGRQGPLPQAWQGQRVEVYAPDGALFSIPATSAKRLQLERGDMMTGGELADLIGEIGDMDTTIKTNKVREVQTTKPLIKRNLWDGWVTGGNSEEVPPYFAP